MVVNTYFAGWAARIATIAARARAALPGARGKARLVLSVRTKGLMVLAALIVYSVAIAAFAFSQKNQLLGEFDAIQESLETETLLKQVDLSAFHAVMATFAAVEAPQHASALDRIELYHQPLHALVAQLRGRVPEKALDETALDAAWEAAEDKPSRATLNHLSVELITVKNSVADLTELVQGEREARSARFRTQADSVAISTFLLGMLGLGLLGAIIVLFFRRLTDDLQALQSRALAVVNGFRGRPLAITRRDEVGRLMSAVNDMADTLDQRDKELMLERQKYFHQEKMAAIGTLAAGVSHEIGNPIAAISGIAQQMIDRRTGSGHACAGADCNDCRPDLIHAQAQRLAAITREIAEFASPRAVEPQLLDLNAQLRSTSSLIRYDKRLEGVALELDLDSQLPAVYGVADQLTQLIMNLLINAMDALDGGVAGGVPTIVVSTRADATRAIVTVADNGHGIDAATLERVFEAFFTTKPAGKGTGLGLSLCYAIAKRHGGSIEIDSAPGAGTRVVVALPLTDDAYNETN
jgi:two-component system NtrC family sensor kinase